MNEVPRDPYRLIWPCHPQHGLIPLLKIVARVREYEPLVNLRVIHLWLDADTYIRKQIDKLPQENVEWLSWTDRDQIEREARSANLWCFPSLLQHPHGVPAIDLMRFGCVPIFRPTEGLRKIVGHGFPVPGDPRDPLVKCRYAAIIRDLVNDAATCESVRADMIPWASDRYDQLTGGGTCS